ncbi:transcription antitermination factor NusB [Blastococcus sp. CT_GayMR16]|uniref:RsmB/NOP family class I SAM-dependent RNA methyltransferase n=1 Tax=Blastococcus sp. CT_GayMR16 TaxID=2559607 RepID=UPI0010731A4C|nr:transcription antitermination factor NusB [Blastococcus sp. CT_GayMR16]TFV86174.1 rRNA cytosine-C5-methyltransferase [Blastococcus sp. CT_GayMR16]
MTRPPRKTSSGPRPGQRRHPATRRPVLDGARLTAYDVLDGVSSRAAYANLLLPQLLRERQLEERDAAFATQLAYGTLRAQGTLDAVLTGLVSRPLGELDPRVLDLLRLGAYQLIDLRVPSHAAVDTTVDLTRGIVGTGASGLVNAVLRKVATGGDRSQWLDTLGGDAGERLALATNHPRWIVDAWREALGGEDELEAALLADDAAPDVHLVARRISREQLVEESGGEPGPWSPFAVRLHGGDPGRLPSVRSGAAGVQDEGSQVAALLLARAPLEGSDTAWLDMCAGPGGKTGLLAAVRPDGVHITAADRAPHRAELVRHAVAGEADVEVIAADGTRPPWAPGSFDRVLLDAPCTGLGALRRRPEVRWRRTPDDVPPLVELQTALLDSALSSVRIGGIVAYVTCSPHSAETVAVVDAAAARDDVEVVPVAPLFPEVPDTARGDYGQLWPHRHGTDAMFMALLRRAR